MSIPKAKVDSTLPTLLASKAFIDGTDSVAVFKANPDASSKNQVEYRTDPEKSPKMASSSSFQVQFTVTPTVLGGGGIWERKSWTSDSKRIRDEGLKIYAKQNKNASLTKDQKDVLTPWRCELYTCPKERPEALAEMLKIRLDHAQLFTKGFDLEGSLRIAGHTKKGATCLLAEVGSTRHSFNNYLNQAINILTLAADMSKPTSGGQAGFYCVNYMPGMSLKHFLNPASAFTMSSLLKSMWRNQLEGFLLVDMPPAFQWFLNLVLKVIPAETREKFKVMSYEESLVEIQKTCEPEFLQEYKRCVARENKVLQSKDDSMRKWDVICSLPFFVNHPRIKALSLSHEMRELSREQFNVFHECSREWLEKGCPNF